MTPMAYKQAITKIFKKYMKKNGEDYGILFE